MLFSVFAGPYDADLAAKIDAYLAAKNSPLAGYGAAFVSSGVFYNVDPRLIVAIAGAESSFALDFLRRGCFKSDFRSSANLSKQGLHNNSPYRLEILRVWM